jgi:HEPN domain-containing protein
MGLRSDSCYTAARERIKEARFLHKNRYYTSAMYVSGLAAECILRAFRLLREIFSSLIVK